ncbi:MAG: single-stranded-DNA-specific exonuclease RecJ [Deltaproteobacteria bacterium]|nr:single-stranded-DNA-specific exonuclease RecJ [Deltaproteobacteria bacterium]
MMCGLPVAPVRKAWRLCPPLPHASPLSRETGVTPLQAQLLFNRGILDPDSARVFLSPTLSQMADPMEMKGIRSAVGTILGAVEHRRKVTVYGDYDADGLTATALLWHFFADLGVEADAYVPDRLTEGYGLNSAAIRRIAHNGTDLIITVDCGISALQETALAMDLGMDVVVTDHHQIKGEISHGCPVVNPHQPGCRFAFKGLAGVGVAFFLAVAVRSALRERGWFTQQPEPDLRKLLDLVALGTVADRVPLVGQNRILVKSGLRCMAQSRWPGIRALMGVSNVEGSEISSEDLAFRVAPRLNAPGRLGHAEDALNILTVKEMVQAESLARQLNRTNSRRQKLEQEILSEIEKKAGQEDLVGHRRTLLFGGADWHQGVLGIVASRLVDRFHRPALVFNITDGVATGSGRSIDGFDLFKALGRNAHLFERFGGHAHAVGLRLETGNLAAVEEGFEACACEMLSDETLIPVIRVDARVGLDRVGPEFMEQVAELAPFGEKNAEPVFMAGSVEVLDARVVGENHLKMRVRQGKTTLEAIGFRMGHMKPVRGACLHLLFSPEYNRWQGRDRLQLRLVDVRSSSAAIQFG